MHVRLRRPSAALISTTLAASVLGLAPAAHAADGTLSGTVTGSGAAELVDVEVELFEYNDVDQYWEGIDYTYTGEDGSYSFVVPAGSYRIGFNDYQNGFVSEYYEDAESVREADTVVVPSAGTFVADAELAEGAHITGAVTGPGGTDLAEVYVTAYEPVEEDGYVYYNWAGSAWTDVDGTYDIHGLAGGSYVVGFRDGFFEESQTYAAEYYDDATTRVEADVVTVAAQGTASDIDAELGLDAAFSGRVTDSTGAGVEDAWVDALIKVGDEWEYTESAYTAADGSYVLDGLRAGTYRVEIGGRVGAEYAYEYWNDKGRIENADDVVVTVGTETPGVDAVLVPGEHDAETTVTNTALPTISGAPVVGSTLTASVGSWTPAPTEYYYDWLRDGEFIPDAYGSTYVPTAADIGKKITVLVTAGADDYFYGHAESVPTAPVTAAVTVTTPTTTPTPTPTPTVDVPAALAAIVAGLDVSGKPKVGKTVKVTGLDKLFRSSTAVSYKFQWFAGKKKIAKATKSKLKITRAMKGKKLSVKVTAKAASTTRSVKLKVGKVR
ncbi:carboxypeptidase regulatory-like domain-containing protein [Nocardioides eburneiflavus]|uniref:Carboxypeptidase regulatory-like domain-containing protein n=1 Tax=Nocardioides eburneiflavus TaxID=2518372 RepID=A0A4Z1BQ56_9ACTN|nr:carboxypeptidase regulatory-like domain-containing protein [Nocardioides eburneiflavus]TGN63471.1 carboxypeptidase regulatory-like domain-containing protein [Nocardioides eburneiflavus]